MSSVHDHRHESSMLSCDFCLHKKWYMWHFGFCCSRPLWTTIDWSIIAHHKHIYTCVASSVACSIHATLVGWKGDNLANITELEIKQLCLRSWFQILHSVILYFTSLAMPIAKNEQIMVTIGIAKKLKSIDDWYWIVCTVFYNDGSNSMEVQYLWVLQFWDIIDVDLYFYLYIFYIPTLEIVNKYLIISIDHY